MKTTISIIVLALFCLNFCYGQGKQNCNASTTQPYKYDISGFKSGYKPGYRITDDEFMKGKSIIVRNYSITQLFALALRLDNAGNTSANAKDTSEEQTKNTDRILMDVREPEKLKSLHCFQLVVPFYLTDNFYVIMQACLNAEFPDYVVKMERKDAANYMVIKDKVY
jgi:hypothetical protein